MTARKAPADFGAAATARRRRPANTTTTTATPAAARLSAAMGGQRKYTVLIDDLAADAFDERLLDIRRQLGRKVDKSQVVRELLALLDDDPVVLAAVVKRLKLQ